MARKKTVICPKCNETLTILISDETAENGLLFSLACLHHKDSRVLIATFDQDLFVRKLKCLEVQRSLEREQIATH